MKPSVAHIFKTTPQEILPEYQLMDGTTLVITSTLWRTETCLRITQPTGTQHEVLLGSMPIPDHGVYAIQGLCTEILLGNTHISLSLDVWLVFRDIELNQNLLRSIIPYIDPNSYSLAAPRMIELLKNKDGRLDATMCLELVKRANPVSIGMIAESLCALLKDRDMHPGVLAALLRKVRYPSPEAMQAFMQLVRKGITPKEPFTISYAGQSSYDAP